MVWCSSPSYRRTASLSAPTTDCGSRIYGGPTTFLLLTLEPPGGRGSDDGEAAVAGSVLAAVGLLAQAVVPLVAFAALYKHNGSTTQVLSSSSSMMPTTGDSTSGATKARARKVGSPLREASVVGRRVYWDETVLLRCTTGDAPTAAAESSSVTEYLRVVRCEGTVTHFDDVAREYTAKLSLLPLNNDDEDNDDNDEFSQALLGN